MTIRDNLKFVAVGHVDHGKSTLIGRLLYDTGSLPPDKMDEVRRFSESADGVPEFAFVMDHLEEERQKRITIDTAQIFFKTDKREYTIIDAPGHKQFLKNMITGSTQAQAALLLVDVKEGLREQTHRHSYLLSLLGIKQLVVVINKMDLIEYSLQGFTDISNAITARLNELGLKPLAVIPISARLGDNVATKSRNISWYAGPTLLEALDELQPTSNLQQKYLRLPIQDTYEIEDEKVLVGRIASGSLNIGQSVMLQPSGELTSIKAIRKWPNNPDSVGPGESIGLVLADDNIFDSPAQRGNIICSVDDSPDISNQLTATVFWMNPRPLHKGDTLIFKCATQQVPCRVSRINDRLNSSTLEIIEPNADKLQDTEVARLILQMEHDICTDPFEQIPELGRFVLMRDNDTVAGGIIL